MNNDRINFYINTKVNLLKEITRQKDLFENDTAFYKQVTKISILINCAQNLLLNRLLSEQKEYVIRHNRNKFFGIHDKFFSTPYRSTSYLNSDNGHVDKNGKITWKNPPRSTTF